MWDFFIKPFLSPRNSSSCVNEIEGERWVRSIQQRRGREEMSKRSKHSLKNPRFDGRVGSSTKSKHREQKTHHRQHEINCIETHTCKYKLKGVWVKQEEGRGREGERREGRRKLYTHRMKNTYKNTYEELEEENLDVRKGRAEFCKRNGLFRFLYIQIVKFCFNVHEADDGTSVIFVPSRSHFQLERNDTSGDLIHRLFHERLVDIVVILLMWKECGRSMLC